MRLPWRRTRPSPDRGPVIQAAEHAAARERLGELATAMEGRPERPPWDRPTQINGAPLLTRAQAHRAEAAR